MDRATSIITPKIIRKLLLGKEVLSVEDTSPFIPKYKSVIRAKEYPHKNHIFLLNMILSP